VPCLIYGVAVAAGQVLQIPEHVYDSRTISRLGCSQGPVPTANWTPVQASAFQPFTSISAGWVLPINGE
jgi:hypothetical protein